MATKKRCYAYLLPDGRQGVVDNWTEVEKMVKGRAHARYRGFGSRREAGEWLARGAVYETEKVAPRLAPLAPGIYFDAGTGRGLGVEVSVTDEKGKNLLHKALSGQALNRFGKHLLKDAAATNNYGELLALRYALAIAKKMRIKNIFGDSRLVIDYWSKGRIKRKKLPRATVRLAALTVKMRARFEKSGGAVLRISGAHNPADLGFHS